MSVDNQRGLENRGSTPRAIISSLVQCRRERSCDEPKHVLRVGGYLMVYVIVRWFLVQLEEKK